VAFRARLFCRHSVFNNIVASPAQKDSFASRCPTASAKIPACRCQTPGYRLLPTAYCFLPTAHCVSTVASFLISPRANPLLSSKSVASFFKKRSAFSRQPSEGIEQSKVQGRTVKSQPSGPGFLRPLAFDLQLFFPQTVASFLISPRADPLLSSKSVASFFKKSTDFRRQPLTAGGLQSSTFPVDDCANYQLKEQGSLAWGPRNRQRIGFPSNQPALSSVLCSAFECGQGQLKLKNLLSITWRLSIAQPSLFSYTWWLFGFGPENRNQDPFCFQYQLGSVLSFCQRSQLCHEPLACRAAF